MTKSNFLPEIFLYLAGNTRFTGVKWSRIYEQIETVLVTGHAYMTNT